MTAADRAAWLKEFEADEAFNPVVALHGSRLRELCRYVNTLEAQLVALKDAISIVADCWARGIEPLESLLSPMKEKP